MLVLLFRLLSAKGRFSCFGSRFGFLKPVSDFGTDLGIIFDGSIAGEESLMGLALCGEFSLSLTGFDICGEFSLSRVGRIIFGESRGEIWGSLTWWVKSGESWDQRWLFFHFSKLFIFVHFFSFLGFLRNSRIFQSHGLFWDFYPRLFGKIPWDFFPKILGFFFRGMGNLTKKPPLPGALE